MSTNKITNQRDIDKDLILENEETNFTFQLINKDVNIQGSTEEGKESRINLEDFLYIIPEYEDLNVKFSNVTFDTTDEIKDGKEIDEQIALITIGIFEMNADLENRPKAYVTFDHCNFYGFQNEKLYCLALGDNCVVTFNNCNFSADRYGVFQLGNSVATCTNCIFDSIFDTFWTTRNHSSFKFDKCKARVDNECFISIEDQSEGSIENCKFTSEFVKPEEKDVEKYETENPDAFAKFNYNCISNLSQGKINIYNCQFSNFYSCIFSVGEENSNMIIMDCKVKNSYTGIWLNKDGEYRIVNTTVDGCYKSGISGTGNVTIDLYDSSITKTTDSGITLFEASKANLRNCKISNNGGFALQNGEETEINIHECTMHNNAKVAIMSETNKSLHATKCSFNDNVMFNVIVGGEGDAYFDDCIFLATKKRREKAMHFHITCAGKSKLHLDNCTLSSNDKEFSGFLSDDESNVYGENCKFRNLEKLAILNKKSKIYIKDSDMKDIDNPIACNEEEAVLEMVGCGGKLGE